MLEKKTPQESSNHNPSELLAKAKACLEEAKKQGATAAEVGLSVESGLSIGARMGDVETVEHHQSRGLGLTVYMGKRKGSSSTSDLSEQAMKDAVMAACRIAKYAAEDPFSGLPDPSLLADSFPDLDLYHPWEIDTDTAIAMAVECEASALNLDSRITNSEGASLNTFQGTRVLGNSDGFLHAYSSTRHSLSVSVIGEDQGQMQRDDWWSVTRDRNDLPLPAEIGRIAAERAIGRLGARRLSSRECPVVFAADVASSLFGNLISAIRGGNLYRKSSFLLDQIGKQIFPAFINIHESPFIPKGLGSAPYDAEGVRTSEHFLVENGVLSSYVLSTYSARKLGLTSTGNAGGVHNLIVDPNPLSFNALLEEMNEGLVITELMGQGVNLVNGDYSRGAAGFWVEQGKIAYPVEEITIAGNLKNMFMDIQAVANDVDLRGNTRTGSVLIRSMTIAGN